MGGSLHFEAPTALEYFAALVADDASFSVTEAAVAVAQDEFPQLDPQDTLAQIDALADRLRRRLHADVAPMQKLRLLNRYFFQELGFAGNVNDYYDPRNSYLPEVLKTLGGLFGAKVRRKQGDCARDRHARDGEKSPRHRRAKCDPGQGP